MKNKEYIPEGFDFSAITHRVADDSYVVMRDGMPYHVPNENGFTELWYAVTQYTKEHPEVVTEEHPYEPTLQEQIEEAYRVFDSNVEARLNFFAATRRYNDIYTASNYKDSHIEKYATEGQYCYKMLAETYAKCEELLAEYMPEVLVGERPIPTWEEIEALLPPLVWPDEQVVQEEPEPSTEAEAV